MLLTHAKGVALIWEIRIKVMEQNDPLEDLGALKDNIKVNLNWDDRACIVYIRFKLRKSGRLL